MTPETETKFAHLLRIWNRHQELRTADPAEIVDLVESRRRLDEARQSLRLAA